MSSDRTLSARALASRLNGARSRGPKTAAGKARSARNALKHGLCAKKLLVLPEEDMAAFKALEAALLAELAPAGALQAVLAARIVSAAWRLARADRMEAEVLAYRGAPNGDLGIALMRDGNGTRSIETLLRYRNAAIAELLRAQRLLQALQAEAPAGVTAAPRRRLLAPPNEPTKPRRINALIPEPAAVPQDALARNLPDAGQATLPPSAPRMAPDQHLDPRPPRQSPDDARDRDLSDTGPALPSPVARTKPTRERTSNQELGVGAKC